MRRLDQTTAGPKMRKPRMAFASSVLWLATGLLLRAGSSCELCETDFGTNAIYVATDHVRQIKRHICEKCSRSKVVCSVCYLAANPKTMLKLEDGRILCERDAKDAILSEAEAGDIFNEVKREVQRILAHWAPLPDRD